MNTVSDRRVMMDCHSGECFRREDGGEWEAHGYKMSRVGHMGLGNEKPKEGKLKREARTAYGDHGDFASVPLRGHKVKKSA